MIRPLPPVLLLLALAAPVAARRDTAPPPATPAGAPVACIPLRAIDETRVRDDRTIDFLMRDRSAYRVTLPQPCPGLGFQQRFSYATAIDRLCSADIITVIDTPPMVRGASCGLAPFQPVTLPRR